MGSNRTFLLIAAAALAAPSLASAQDTGTHVVVVGAMQDTGTHVVVIGAMQDTGTHVVVVGATQDSATLPPARTGERAPPTLPVVYEDEPAPAPAPARTPAPHPGH
jgi:hypothetical protein